MDIRDVFPPDTRPISEAQVRRLYALVHQVGWDNDELHWWLLETHGIEHVADITRNQYDLICRTVDGEFNA